MPDLHDAHASSSLRPAPTAPDHLNTTGCSIKYAQGNGRRVYASRAIPGQTLLEISPVLLFSVEEYEAHGRHTVLDHYTLKWRDGRMALALGLGSLFNHSDAPNVTYTIDASTESVRYTTTRAVEPNEELCIHHPGPNLWPEPVGASQHAPTEVVAGNGCGGLSTVTSETSSPAPEIYPDGNEIVPEEDLPFTRVKLTPDEDDEDTPETIRTVQAWAVDIPDPRHTTTALTWLKSSGLDTPTLAHLKRVRKSPHGTHSTLLLTAAPHAPALPPALDLAPPYALRVPRSAALTPASLALKNALWPTVYAPRRKGEPEEWARARARWACAAMARVVAEGRAAAATGELPIASYVPAPPEDPSAPSYLARDTRVSASHPLRHSVLNVVRALADSTTSASTSASSLPVSPSPSPSPGAPTKSGQHYLLTSRTLFTTHEPCLMCAMALLHSRVKEVFFLVPRPRTGGCGGAACVPKLEGVNHRFAIARWKAGAGGVGADGLDVDEHVDA
ncbi:cytidine deaminase-like protein [Gloeopeniophorella convolvens]|nr:cytidine deaminase-like protein [Gloeopeniophorella convolvens]